jgi:hypothetical protein
MEDFLVLRGRTPIPVISRGDRINVLKYNRNFKIKVMTIVVMVINH